MREFVDLAFARAGLDPDDHVRSDPQFFRPAEVVHLVGDASKAREQLGWQPRTSFRELVELMVDADIERARGTGTGRSSVVGCGAAWRGRRSRRRSRPSSRVSSW